MEFWKNLSLDNLKHKHENIWHEEKWLDINWMPLILERYQISSFGRIKSLKSNCRGHRIMTLIKNERGYLWVKLKKNKKKAIVKVHRLVSIAFIKNPHQKPQVNHKNGNPLDNFYLNLEWTTRSENMKHAFDKLGRKVPWLGKKGADNHNSIPVIQYSKEGEFINQWSSMADAERHFDKISGAISTAIKLKTCAYGFKWVKADI